MNAKEIFSTLGALALSACATVKPIQYSNHQSHPNTTYVDTKELVVKADFPENESNLRILVPVGESAAWSDQVRKVYLYDAIAAGEVKVYEDRQGHSKYVGVLSRANPERACRTLDTDRNGIISTKEVYDSEIPEKHAEVRELSDVVEEHCVH